MASYIPAILRNNRFSQAPSGDKIDPTQLPLSGAVGNIAQIRSDGIFAGNDLPSAVYYVNTNGVDATNRGSRSSPYKTVDYALSQIIANAGTIRNYNVSLALQCGQTFVLNQRYTIDGNLTFTWYGDSKYTDFNTPRTWDPSVMTDLNRPILQCSRYVFPQWSMVGCSGITMTSNYKLVLSGIKLNLPTNLGSDGDSSYTTCDFAMGDMHLDIRGAIINKIGIPCYFGLIGVQARSSAKLTQISSVFTVMDQKQDSSSSNGLTQRPHFIHFYFDALNLGLAPFLFTTSSNSSNGSGILELAWSDNQATTVNGNPAQASFPVLSNVQYGLRNYFTNLNRDQQSRPLNVISGRNF